MSTAASKATTTKAVNEQAADAADEAATTPSVAAEPAAEARVERFVGRKVVDLTGETIGRIEEVCAEMEGEEYVVREFHVGSLAGLERLFGGRFGRAFLRRLTGNRLWTGYVVPWEAMDLTDPTRPRVRRRKGELERMQ